MIQCLPTISRTVAITHRTPVLWHHRGKLKGFIIEFNITSAKALIMILYSHSFIS
jgi:hypothetical protein